MTFSSTHGNITPDAFPASCITSSKSVQHTKFWCMHLLKNNVKRKYICNAIFNSYVRMWDDKSRKNNNKMARISLASALATMCDAWKKENNLFFFEEEMEWNLCNNTKMEWNGMICRTTEWDAVMYNEKKRWKRRKREKRSKTRNSTDIQLVE